MTRVNILKGLTVFLIRKKMGLKKNEKFMFSNQKSKTDMYWFDKSVLWKHEKTGNTFVTRKSDVGLNWLLSDKCKIKRFLELPI